MKKAILLLACALATSGCDNRRANAETAVREALKDPESAVFSESILLSGEGSSLAACGMVNAKNAFGGYTGENAYMVWDGRVFMDPDAEMALNIQECCFAVVRTQESGQALMSQEDSRTCTGIGGGQLAPSLLD